MSQGERTGPRVLAATRAATAVGWTAGMLAAVSLHEALVRASRQEQTFESYMRPWAEVLLRIMGARVHRAPGDLLAARGPRLIVANHRSALDIGIMLSCFGGSLVSRADLATWPLLGLAAKKAQTIFVDQGSRHSGLHAIKQIREQLRRGRTVCVFPEGTTFAGDEIRPFARGVFSAARGLDVEVIPVGVAYATGHEYMEDSFMAHVSAIAGRLHNPVAVEIGTGQALKKNANQSADHFTTEVGTLVRAARARLDAHSPKRASLDKK